MRQRRVKNEIMVSLPQLTPSYPVVCAFISLRGTMSSPHVLTPSRAAACVDGTQTNSYCYRWRILTVTTRSVCVKNHLTP